jgi:hypothetical protein
MSARSRRSRGLKSFGAFVFLVLAVVAAGVPAAAGAGGAVLWETEGAPSYGYSVSALSALSPNGDVFVGALSDGDSALNSFYVTCYKPGGGVRWQKSARLYADVCDLTAMAADGRGGVVVTGYANSYGNPVSWVTCRWSATGVLTYQQSLNLDGARANDVVCDGFGNAYVAGVVGLDRTAAPHADWYVIKYDRTGATVWSRSFAGAGGQNDAATEVARDADGRIYVAGTTIGVSDLSTATVLKYTAAGRRSWKRFWSGPAATLGVNVHELAASAGGAAVCGFALDASARAHPYALRFAPGGQLAWARTYRYKSTEEGEFNAVAMDKAGNVVAAGRRTIVHPADWDMLVTRYKVGGGLAWTRLRAYAGSAETVGAVTLAGDGTIFITGSSEYLDTGPERDCATWSLKPTGTSRWFRIRSHMGFMAGDDVVVTAKAAYVSGGHGGGGWFLTKYVR